MEMITKYILLFFFYSVSGWCVESLYCSIGEQKLINRGFLTGPLCPIYGCGALIMIIFLYNPFKDNALAIFLLGMVLCDMLEYATSFLMEKLFAARWWDYTYEFMNIKGRICLKHSLYWGIGGIVFVKLIHPQIDYMYDNLVGSYATYVLIGVLIIFCLDVMNATRKALDIRKLQLKLNSLIEKVTENISSVKETIGDTYTNVQNNLAKRSDKVYDVSNELSEQIQDVLKQFEQRTKKTTQKAKNKLYNRLFYNNPRFESRTKKQLDKLKSLRDDIKSNIFEKDEMQ